MATNFKQEGDVLDLAMPYDRTSGQGVLVGKIFGVVLVTALSGVVAAVKTSGVFNVTKLTSDTVTVGALLYWDNTNKRLTTTSTSNQLVGCAAAAASSSDTTVDIWIHQVMS